MPSCSETADCPNMWECDEVAELCVRAEPADFFWNYIIGSLSSSAAALIALVVLTSKQEETKKE